VGEREAAGWSLYNPSLNSLLYRVGIWNQLFLFVFFFFFSSWGSKSRILVFGSCVIWKAWLGDQEILAQESR
jgi:hypothetical protein